MPKKQVIQGLKYYQKSGMKVRQIYLKNFEEKMIYRTTKTENPQTTPKMVKDVLSKFKKV